MSLQKLEDFLTEHRSSVSFHNPPSKKGVVVQFEDRVMLEEVVELKESLGADEVEISFNWNEETVTLAFTTSDVDEE